MIHQESLKQVIIFSELRSYTSNPTNAIVVLGGDNINDGKGGTFYWDALNISADDNLNIIKVDDLTIGRWVRLNQQNQNNNLAVPPIYKTQEDIQTGGYIEWRDTAGVAITDEDVQPFAVKVNDATLPINQLDRSYTPARLYGFDEGAEQDITIYISKNLTTNVNSVAFANITGNPSSNQALVAQTQNKTLDSFTTTGTSTAYVGTPTPAIISLVNGQQFNVNFHTANTTTNPTINISGLGAENLFDTNGVALTVGACSGSKTIRRVSGSWRVIGGGVSTFVGLSDSPRDNVLLNAELNNLTNQISKLKYTNLTQNI